MRLYNLQKLVYANKVRRDFNVSDVGKEVILMSEEFGEFCDAYIEEDDVEIADAFGDIIMYCLGLSAMFEWNAEEIVNKDPSFKASPQTAADCMPYIGRSIGRIAKTYKKSNKRPVATIDLRDDFKTHIGDLMGYCLTALAVIDVDPYPALERIVKDNYVREHEGQI